jgi:hypothetical protein
MVILRATNDDGVKVDLDVLESDNPILLDISAIENATIGDVFGVSSQTFSLPGTDKNNQFFGNLFNLGSTPAVALQDSIPCQVLTDGQAVFTGRLYITDIITDQQGYTTYQVNIVNETVDFKFILTDTYLSQLDWSAYNHAYTYGNITGSWDGLIASGAIVYPNVDYGRTEGDTFAPTYAFSNNLNTVAFDNSSKPLRVIDFKPAIQVKAVLDTIFESIDYEYTSSFIDSAYFQDLYTLTTPNDGIGVQNENPTTGSFYVFRSGSNQTFNALTDTKINFNAELYDNFGRYDLINDEFTAYAKGQYGFTLAFNFSISNYDANNNLRFFVTLQDDLGSPYTGRTFVAPPQSGQLIAPFALLSLEPGDKVRAFVELFTDDGSEVVTVGFGQTSTYFTPYSTPKSAIGATINMGEQFPSDLKALDFLQGLIEKFNLVIEPVPGTRNVLRIEPFQDWIDQGVQKDWTNKIDRNTRFKIVHPITEQPKTITFSDEDDNDSINQYTVERFTGNVYGTYIYTNESDLALGERKIGSTFAATPVKNIPNSTDFIIPMLHKREPGQEPRPFAFKPRLLYGNGKKTVPADALGGSIGNGGLARGIIGGRYFFEDEVGTIHPVTSWYQMTTYESLPTSNTSRDLHFGNRKNPGFWPYFQTSLNGYTANSAFHYYWETYINSLYDIDARKLTCNVYLEPTEIQNIALNDKYFIDGAYYRINKINGANLSYRDTVEVELIKQLNRQLIYPRRRVLDLINNRFVDIQVREEDSSGNVEYQFWDGGATVEDFGLINQASPRDGYIVFQTGTTGSVSWDTINQVDIPLDRQVSAGNQVDQIAARVNVNGTNNTIKQNVTDATVLGTSNTIQEFTDTVYVSGFDNNVDFNLSNVSIINGLNSTVSGSDNSVIIGGTGSLFVNNDWVVDINGTLGAIRDSDVTTAINRAQDEVIINGSGHTVINLNLEGGGLDLLNTRNNSAWLGDTYLGEGLLVNSYTLDVGDGTNIFLTGSNLGQGKHETLYILNWNGLSPGTASINLPSAANSNYKGVVYTFKLASGNSGEIVRIIPFDPAQTIDGATSYQTTGSYAFVSIHASGSKWHVIDSSAGGGGTPGPSGSAFPFTGSAQITGSLSVTGSVTATGGFFGNLIGTSSYATTAEQVIIHGLPAGQVPICLAENLFVSSRRLGVDEADFYYNTTTNRLQVDNITATTLTGSLLGTASFASTASFTQTVGTASFATSASYSLVATSASYASSASQAACSDTVDVLYESQPQQGDTFYFVSTIGTGSSCDTLYNSIASPYYSADDDILYFPDLASGSFEGSFSGSFTGSITSASFAATAAFAPNIYNTDGELTDNRVVTLGGNNLTFVADQGETFEIASDPGSDVLISGLPLISGSNIVYYNTTSGKLSYGPAVSGSITGSGNAFPFTGSAQIIGSLTVTGSIAGEVKALTIASNTASMDLSTANFFTLNLVSGSTYINPTNIRAGQTKLI